jgi:hypothetical protein
MASWWSEGSASSRSPGFELVQRLVPADACRPHNDVAGFIYAALGVIYAVLLALVVIAVWEEFQTASETVEQEANAAADIFWLADRLPEARGSHLQELVRSYAQEVVKHEWPLMAATMYSRDWRDATIWWPGRAKIGSLVATRISSVVGTRDRWEVPATMGFTPAKAPTSLRPETVMIC